MNLSKQTKFAIGAWVALVAFLGLTEPDKLPVVVLIVPYVLLFLSLFGLWASLGQLRARYFARGRPHLRLGAVVCASVVMLLALQSLGQLSLRDVLTVGAIVAVGYLYSGRTGFHILRHQSNTYDSRL